MKRRSLFTIRELKAAAKKAGETLQYRLNRPVITEAMARHMPCPFCRAMGRPCRGE